MQLFVISDLDKADMLTVIFKNMKVFTETVNFIVDHKGMFIQGMDSNHICLHELTLPASWFDEWHLEEDEGEMIFGIMSETLCKIFDSRAKTHIINAETDNDMMKIVFSDGTGENVYDEYFSTPQLKIDFEVMTTGGSEYDAEFKISTNRFTTLMTKVSKFGEKVRFKCEGTNVTLSTESTTGTTINVPVKKEDFEEFKIDDALESQYDVKYLINMCKFAKLSDSIYLGVGVENPLSVSYKMEEDVTMYFYLAPFMDEEEDTNE